VIVTAAGKGGDSRRRKGGLIMSEIPLRPERVRSEVRAQLAGLAESGHESKLGMSANVKKEVERIRRLTGVPY
jgi:hypothetical protein